MAIDRKSVKKGLIVYRADNRGGKVVVESAPVGNGGCPKSGRLRLGSPLWYGHINSVYATPGEALRAYLQGARDVLDLAQADYEAAAKALAEFEAASKETP